MVGNVAKLLSDLQDHESKTRRDAATALSSLDSAVLSNMLEVLRNVSTTNELDDRLASDVAWAIGNNVYPEIAVPELIEILKSSQNSLARKEAAQALKSIGNEAREAIPALIKALSDDDRLTRRDAATALGCIGETTEYLTKKLLDRLEDIDIQVRSAAARALGKLNAQGEEVVGALNKAVRCDHIAVQIHAVAAMAVIQPSTKEFALDYLSECFNSEYAHIRLESIVAAKSLPEELHIDKRIRVIATKVCDPNASVRAEATYALSHFEEIAREFSDTISSNMIDDSCYNVRVSSTHTLKNVFDSKNYNEIVVDRFVLALRDKEAMVREVAASALKKLGAVASRAVPELCVAIHDPNPGVGIRAALALSSIAPKNLNAIEVLIEALNHDFKEMRLISASTLLEMGSDAAKRSLDSLIDMLESNDEWLTREATSLLKSSGSNAVSSLVDAFQRKCKLITELKNPSPIRISQSLNPAEVLHSNDSNELSIDNDEQYNYIIKMCNFVRDNHRATHSVKITGISKGAYMGNALSSNEKRLELLQAALDNCVNELVTERANQARKLTKYLNEYLNMWCVNQDHLERIDPCRSHSQIAKEKHDLAEYVGNNLNRLNLVIRYDDTPSILMSNKGRPNSKGYFVLMPQGSKSPLVTRVELKELLEATSDGSKAKLGFELAESAMRKEDLIDWRMRVRRTLPIGQSTNQQR